MILTTLPVKRLKQIKKNKFLKLNHKTYNIVLRNVSIIVGDIGPGPKRA